MVGGFIGAHLYYLFAVVRWPFHPVPSGALLDIFDGTAVQGGILGGICAAAVFLRRRGLSFLPVCDVLSPGGALAQGIARVGCFLAGCCYGRPTNLFLGVVYTSPLADPDVPRGVPLHPAQLYETFLDGCLALFLQSRLRADRRRGSVFGLYLMGAGAIRFAVQFFRDDDAGRLAFGLAHSQYMALALFAAAATFYLYLNRRKDDEIRNNVA
jgi:phosphatidylglycerol:prolipoprotein diacylglycerol transferase